MVNMREVIQQYEGQEGSFVHLVRPSSITRTTEFPYVSPLSALMPSYWAKMISNLDWNATSDEKIYPFPR